MFGSTHCEPINIINTFVLVILVTNLLFIVQYKISIGVNANKNLFLNLCRSFNEVWTDNGKNCSCQIQFPPA